VGTGPETDPDIGDECGLFLAGRYAEHFRTRQRHLPLWVWLNPLAHGTRDEIASWAAGACDRPESREWSQAITFLAVCVLDMAGDDDPRLEDLQRDVLIPLELRLAERWFERMTPSRFVKLVSADLGA
jgi:hypothetical protein